jgi:MoxR-like ATPase
MVETDDLLPGLFRAPNDSSYDLGSRFGDRRDGQVYVHDDSLRLAVRVAIATGRPLLLRGPAGSGKSSLAPFVARVHKRRFYKETITARTEARDLMWYFDALKRLNDAQVHSASRSMRVQVLERYVEPRALWWAFDERSAARRGIPPKHRMPTELAEDPGIGPRRKGALVLIDEIDKADPDVPNNLLECLGSLQFTVAETGREVRARQAPLVIITTNDERELPAAFYRRCVVHSLREHDRARLVEIAGQHFGGLDDLPTRSLYEAVAIEVERYRNSPDRRQLRRPSTAEYLDAVRACVELSINTDDDAWKDVARLTLVKPSPEPNS